MRRRPTGHTLKQWVADLGSRPGIDLRRGQGVFQNMAAAMIPIIETEVKMPVSNKAAVSMALCSILWNRCSVPTASTAADIRKAGKKLETLGRTLAAVEDCLASHDKDGGSLDVWYDASFKRKEGATPGFEELRAGLYQLRKVAENRRAALEKQRSAAGQSSDARFIRESLAPLYKQAFGKAATTSRTNDGIASGPFVRFAILVERETNPFEQPQLKAEAIAKALRIHP